MKNIIWQIGGGRLAYFSYADDVDTQAMAVAIKAADGVDANWIASAFDKALPAAPQEAWRLVNGEVAATAAEIEADRVAKLPTPLQQIRVLEQAHDDAQRKLNRQAAIDTALTVACRNPAAANMTRAQVHEFYYLTNRGYRMTVDLEAACEVLRKQIV